MYTTHTHEQIYTDEGEREREMYYDKDDIDELLKCANCNERLEEPCTLPCGHAVCAHCTSSSTHWFILPIVDTENNSSEQRRAARQLVCNTCLEVHRIPAAGFPLNQVLLKLLKTKPTKPPQHVCRCDSSRAPAVAAVQLAREQCAAHIDKCFERLVLEIGSRSTTQARQELEPAAAVVAEAGAASESKRASLLEVDFACMKKLELSGVFGNFKSSFMRIICCQSLRVQAQVTLPSRLAVAFYRKHQHLFLTMADNKSIGTCVWSENNNVVLAPSDCLTCQHDAHILVYMNMPSKGKACLKLFEASLVPAHIRLVAASITYVHRAVCVAMNARALYVATNLKQIVTFDNKQLVETKCACWWPRAIEHLGATDQLLVVVDSLRHVTTLNCADLGQQMRVFSILDSLPCQPAAINFHIHANKHLLVYSPASSCRDKLRVYDLLEGNKTDERQMLNVPPHASFVLAGDLDQRLVFVDSASSTLHFY